MARVRIGYFLEDRAHENFLKALVSRIAQEEGFSERDLIHDVRSCRGGRVIPEYRRFLKECRRGSAVPFDILVVAVDSNCEGYNGRARELRQCAERAQYPALDRIVLAIPDPHIERWYLIDAEAVRKALNTSRGPDIPAYKCEKGYYKRVLAETVRSAGIESPLGGEEYGERIIQNIVDWYHIAEKDIGLEHFLRDLRLSLRGLKGRGFGASVTKL